MGKFYGKALVIDNNHKFIEAIKEEEKILLEYPCLFAKTFKEATQLLKNPKHNIRVVFLSSSVSPSHGMDELKEVKTSRPLLPVFLISHHPEIEPKEILAPECGFNKVIPGPKDFSPLVKELDGLFLAKEAWTDVAASQEEKDVELTLVDDGYIPTILSDFVVTPKSFFNLFIKLGQSKYIKVLNAGDALQADLLETYAKKGMKYLYISAEEHKKYISFCGEISQKLINRQDVHTSKKIKNVLNLGSNIAQSLIHTGISPDKLDFANTFLNQSVSLIKSMRLRNESIKKFIDSIESKEHSAAVSFLAGIIANEVGIESLKAVKVVGIAALLHDIGLYDLDPEFKEEDLENLTEEQQKIFDRHQKHGGEILRSAGGFDEVIYQAVECHHMRRRGTETSRRTNNINMVTEIIGAADELHNIIANKNADPQKLHFFLAQNIKSFSPQIEKAILKLMQNKKAA